MAEGLKLKALRNLGISYAGTRLVDLTAEHVKKIEGLQLKIKKDEEKFKGRWKGSGWGCRCYGRGRCATSLGWVSISPTSAN
ncbi:hypothetical protein E3N88_30883 [Mikania micrantha]|uniref:Uncharacterized protein n=1 Tax=Mikania micrantha TaxID=192012 RepID=A0A5N6MNT8_9ASTR|nr:hypothetical protein E3N88_30883 [Mikania micrantha]